MSSQHLDPASGRFLECAADNDDFHVPFGIFLIYESEKSMSNAAGGKIVAGSSITGAPEKNRG